MADKQQMKKRKKEGWTQADKQKEVGKTAVASVAHLLVFAAHFRQKAFLQVFKPLKTLDLLAPSLGQEDHDHQKQCPKEDTKARRDKPAAVAVVVGQITKVAETVDSAFQDIRNAA